MLLSVKEIISRSLDIYKRDIRVWSPYIILAFVFSLLSFIFTFGTLLWSFLLKSGFPIVLVFIFTVLALLLCAVLGMWVNIAITRVVQKRIENQDVKHFKEELAESKHLLSRSIAVSLLVGLIIGFPLILSVIGFSIVGFIQMTNGFGGAANLYLFFVFLAIYGGLHLIYFSIKFSLSYYVVVLDGKSVRESLLISSQLVKGRILIVFWKLFAPIFVFILVYFLVDYIFTSFASWIGGSIAMWVANIISLGVSVFISPLTTIATLLVYENLKSNPVPEIEKKTK